MYQLPKSVTIIYASTSGNVERVCEYVADILEGHNFTASLHRSEQTDPVDIIQHQLFIFATSTWKHGEINPYFKSVLNDFENLDLSHKFAGMIGLGDVRYEPVLFCGGAEVMRDAFKNAGGNEIGEMLKVNGEPYHQLDSHVKPWIHHYISDLINHPNIQLI